MGGLVGLTDGVLLPLTLFCCASCAVQEPAKTAHFCSMCGPKFCSMNITQVRSRPRLRGRGLGAGHASFGLLVGTRHLPCMGLRLLEPAGCLEAGRGAPLWRVQQC